MNPNDASIVPHIDVMSFVRTLGLGVVFGLTLAVVVKRFSGIVGDRSRFLFIFPLLVPTTVLLISVIKSSLALSLGLVGALSIVRFRTPIKESEELAYLFLAIAIGVGLGAGQVVATSLCFGMMLVLLIALHRYGRRVQAAGIYLDIEGSPNGHGNGLQHCSEAMTRKGIPFQLQRYEEDRDTVAATFYVEPHGVDDVQDLVARLRPALSDTKITVLNRIQPWG